MPASTVSFSYAHLLRRLSMPSYLEREKEAVVFGARRLTYGELYDRAARLGDALAREGFSRGDRVAILLRNDPTWFDVIFAVAALGGVLVPVNFLLKPAEVNFILKDSGAVTLIVGDDLAATAKSALAMGTGCQRVFVVRNAGGVTGGSSEEVPGARDYAAFAATGEPRMPDVHSALEDPTLLQYTSGTTGFPKGATHTVSSLLWNSFHQVIDFDVRADDRYCCFPALCWAAGTHDFTMATLWLGGTIVLYPSGGFSVPALLDTLERERCSRVLLVPTVLKQFVEAPDLQRRDLSHLRYVLSGAEPVPVPVIQRFQEVLPNVTLIQGYGLSEGPTLALQLRAADALRKVGSTGKPTTNTELRIIDDVGADVPPGKPGEIILRSPATMIGYWNRPDATAETMRGGWLHTGDLGVMDEEGYITIAGRKKDMYISGALNVYPAEIESVLLDAPGVAECAVVGVPDEKWGEIGWAVVVPKPGATLEAASLLARCAESLAGYKVPKKIFVSEEPLPRTASGKVKKFAVRAMITGTKA